MDVGVDGDKTVGISDTLRITEDGCESFFTLDRDFTVVDDAASRATVPAFAGDGGVPEATIELD